MTDFTRPMKFCDGDDSHLGIMHWHDNCPLCYERVQYDGVGDSDDWLRATLKAANTELENLRSALITYGSHHPRCEMMLGQLRKPKCNCGWEERRAKLLEE